MKTDKVSKNKSPQIGLWGPPYFTCRKCGMISVVHSMMDLGDSLGRGFRCLSCGRGLYRWSEK